MAKVKSPSNFININEYIIDLVYISENIRKTCRLAQSHRLTYLLEPGDNLRASGAVAPAAWDTA